MGAPLSCSPKGALALFLLSASLLFGQQRYELYADRVQQEANTTRASGDVLLRDESRFLRANRLILCQQAESAELFGNVYFDDAEAKTTFITDYLRLQGGAHPEGWSDNLYAHFNESGLWLSGDEAYHEEGVLHVYSGTLSSCTPHGPDWSIRFSRATHHQEAQWLNLYNARLYAGHVPVLYTPYFGHSTDMTRRSGLLFPRFGYSRREGTLFEQPLYLAPHDWWDLELWHQTRTRRGEGVAATLRFVDSPHSKGQLSAGEFKERSSFQEEYEIENRRHYGVELDYERTRLFSSPRSHHQEGLRLRYQEYSDVDYLQVESIDPDKRDRSVGHILTDELDYFYKVDAGYGGLYLRHFKDLRDSNRKDLVQIQPEGHGHLFSRPLFHRNLLYSLDLRYRNYSREEGLEAQELRAVLPVGYHTSVLNDYLQLSGVYQIDRYQIDYDDETTRGVDSRESLSLSVATMLARDFKAHFHTLGLSATYHEPLEHTRRGEFFNDFSRDRQAGELSDASLSLGLNQYLYNRRGTAVLTHRANQVIQMDRNNTLLELENELIWRPTSRLSLRNLSRYSHEHHTLVRASSSIELSGDTGYSLTHLYRNPDGDGVDQRYLQASAHHRFNVAHRIEGAIERDLMTDETRRYRMAYQYNRGCWQSELSLARTLTPYTTSGGETDSRIHDIIFLRLTFNPLGEVIQQLYEEERG